MKKKYSRLPIQTALIACFIVLAFWVNQYAVDNGTFTNIVSRFGYGGLLLLSIASGFNLIVPIPVIAFFPFFVEIGFHPLLTVAVIAFGMTLGDLLGYLIGQTGRTMVNPKSRALLARIEALGEKHRLLPYVLLFLYAAFSPLPNELIVIPFAFLRFRMWRVMLAVFLGNIIFNMIAAFGFFQLFSFF
jgi:membrane protein YqaA with SNARE-associated domain